MYKLLKYFLMATALIFMLGIGSCLIGGAFMDMNDVLNETAIEMGKGSDDALKNATRILDENREAMQFKRLP